MFYGNNIEIQTRAYKCGSPKLDIEQKNYYYEENLPIGFCTQKENQGHKNCFFFCLFKTPVTYAIRLPVVRL